MLNKQIFFRFLKENYCYKSFLMNYYLNFIIHKNERLKCPHNNAIIAAFTWSETKEGGMFWNNIHLKWTNLYHSCLHHPLYFRKTK